MPRINKKQVQHIHIGKNQLGWSTMQYRNFLMLEFPGVFGDFCLSCKIDSCEKCADVSCLSLSQEQAAGFLDYMFKKGFKLEKPKRKPKPRKKPKGKPLHMNDPPSRAQMKKIDLLAQDIRWNIGVKLGLQGFCNRMIGVPWPQTVGQASKMIEHLKKMKGTQEKINAKKD